MPPTCTVEGCDRPKLSRRRGDRITYYSMCGGHRTRYYKGADMAQPLREQAPRGSGHVSRAGYRFISSPGHPLANAQGKIQEHRAVLYAALGPGAHPCHWCGEMVRWEDPHPSGLEVDHLDGCKTNNALANLVPTCHADNIRRRHAGNPIEWAGAR